MELAVVEQIGLAQPVARFIGESLVPHRVGHRTPAVVAQCVGKEPGAVAKAAAELPDAPSTGQPREEIKPWANQGPDDREAVAAAALAHLEDQRVVEARVLFDVIVDFFGPSLHRVSIRQAYSEGLAALDITVDDGEEPDAQRHVGQREVRALSG